MIISPEKKDNTVSENAILADRLYSIMYMKGYTVLPLKTYENGIYTQSYFCWDNTTPNEDMIEDAGLMMEEYSLKNIIVKCRGNEIAQMYCNDGHLIPTEIKYYPGETNERVYIHNGISFSIIEGVKYFKPKCKSDIKNGMVLELYNNNRWIKRKVVDIDSEYEKIYKLMIKYEKIRVTV